MRREIEPTEGISRDRRPTRPHLAPAQRAVVVSVQADRLVEIAERDVLAAVDAAIIDAQREIALARLMRQSRCAGQGENQHCKSCEKAPHHAVPDPLVRRRGHDRSSIPPAIIRTAGSATTDAMAANIVVNPGTKPVKERGRDRLLARISHREGCIGPGNF